MAFVPGASAAPMGAVGSGRDPFFGGNRLDGVGRREQCTASRSAIEADGFRYSLLTQRDWV
jgi:hypothetical protein